MPSDFKKPGASARKSAPSPSSQSKPDVSAAPADIGLSAAFRSALGGRPGDLHSPVPGLKHGQEVARLAKSPKPGHDNGGGRKVHIGPRSGHK